MRLMLGMVGGIPMRIGMRLGSRIRIRIWLGSSYLFIKIKSSRNSRKSTSARSRRPSWSHCIWWIWTNCPSVIWTCSKQLSIRTLICLFQVFYLLRFSWNHLGKVHLNWPEREWSRSSLSRISGLFIWSWNWCLGLGTKLSSYSLKNVWFISGTISIPTSLEKLFKDLELGSENSLWIEFVNNVKTMHFIISNKLYLITAKSSDFGILKWF